MRLLILLLAISASALAQCGTIVVNPLTGFWDCTGTSGVVSTLAFSGLTSGTNTAAAMVVDTGASLAATGTGTITATSLGSALAANYPTWIKCTVTNSTTNLVVSGTGCTAATIAKAGALTQTIPLFALPAKGYVHNYRIKTSTQFAGPTTLLAGLGTTGSTDLFLVSSTGYNLKTAVSNTQITTSLPLVAGSDTAAASNVVLSLTTTIDNITTINAGAVDVWVMTSTLP